jgi:fatty acid amide hydrolase 2
LAALDVILGEGAWFVPLKRELRDARERAADALSAAGATVRRESLRSMRRALELYTLALKDGSPSSFAEVLADAGVESVSLRRATGGVLRGSGPHTLPTLLLIAFERIGSRIPDRRVQRAKAAAKSLRDEVEGIMGEGVLLHPPHARPAPKHGRTVGRAWAITPTAVFNLLQMPVTQVPLGLNGRGLPLGVQVVARHDADHVAIACALELERATGGWVPPS